MKDDQYTMTRFAQMVERHPELYDSNHEGYNRRLSVEMAWSKISKEIKEALDQDASIEELKVKWKGIRSSYNRYKSKLRTDVNARPYYLYETLNFLEPFVKSRSSEKHHNMFQDNAQDLQDANYFYVGVSDEEYSEEGDVKPKLRIACDTDGGEHSNPIDEDNREGDNSMFKIHKRRRQEPEIELNFDDHFQPQKKSSYSSEEQETLSFFKSILPDIKDFTLKERRKLKLGILKLIDEIEESREKRARHDSD